MASRSRFSGGQRREIEDIYGKYRKPLVGFFRHKLPHDEDPEDMAQQAFARLIEYREKSAIEKPRGLLFRIASGLVTDRIRWRRSHEVRQHDVADEARLVSVQPLQDQVIEGRQALSHFQDQLDALPPRCREVFVLHRVFKLSQKEVAEKMGISISAVEKHVARALTQLRAGEMS